MGWTRSLTVRLPLAIFWLSGSLYAGFANAITLAPIAVRSYLGQNLVVEIDVLNVTAQEEASLKAGVAEPKAFVDLSMDYSQSIGDAQIELLRRPNGTRFIKLRSARPIGEPFVDLVIEVSSSASKLVRPYRLLLDPPPLNEGLVAAPELAERSTVTSTAAIGPFASTEAVPLPPASTAKISAARAKKRTEEYVEKPQDDTKNISVRPGDTAGNIAKRLKPDGATTEQMLIALLQSNPQAFIRGNVNLIQSGASITVPPAETVYQVNEKEARTTLAAQAQAFNTLQRAGKKQIYPASGKEYASSNVKPLSTIESKNTAGKGGDALKLSKNTQKDKKEVEKLEQIAKEKNKQSDLDRAAELAKNIQELNALAKASTAPTAAPASSKPAAPGAATDVGTLSAPFGVAMAQTPANAASAAPTASVAPAPPVSAPPVAKAPATPASSPAPVVAEPDFLEVVLETLANSIELFLIGLGALGLGTAGIIWARKRKDKKTATAAVAATDKNEAPWTTNTEVNNTAYGGDQVDTSMSNARNPAENTVFAAELDPVAEADVYLAYGKDEPAEEILREGLMQDPKRVAIHLKLAEIYAARQDTSNFAICADQVEVLAGTDSADWAQIQSLGQSMEPGNPRYQNTIAATPAASPKGGMLEFENSMFGGNNGQATPATSPPVRVASAAPGLDPVLSFAPGGDSATASAKAKSPKAMPFNMDSLSLDLAVSPSPQTQSISEQLETSMELAKQFIEIGELKGARSMLDEVIANGSDEQRHRAQAMLAKLK